MELLHTPAQRLRGMSVESPPDVPEDVKVAAERLSPTTSSPVPRDRKSVSPVATITTESSTDGVKKRRFEINTNLTKPCKKIPFKLFICTDEDCEFIEPLNHEISTRHQNTVHYIG